MKSANGKLTSETITEVIVCIVDNDHCSAPVVAQLVKEQVGYDINLLNNKLYPILDAPNTRGDFGDRHLGKSWLLRQSCMKKLQAKCQVLKGTKIDLTGGEDTYSPLASGVKKLKFEKEVRSNLNDVKQCLQRLEKRSMIEEETKCAF